MGVSFSSAVTSYSQLAKSLLNSNSFNNTTSLPTLQPVPEPAVSTGESVPVATSEIQLPGLPTTISATTTEGDNPAQDDSQRIVDLVQPRSLAVAAGSFTLLANPPKPATNLPGLYKIYLLFLLLSFVLSTGSLFFIIRNTPSRGVVWLQKRAMKIAIVSIVIAVTLRIFAGLSTPFLWYELLVPFLVFGGIALYLLYGWIKANSSTQTIVPGHGTSAV